MRTLLQHATKGAVDAIGMAQGKRKPVKVLARYYADMTKPRNAVKHRLAPVERGSPRVERTPEGVLDAEIAPGDEVKIVIVANRNAYERYWALVLKVQGGRLWTLTRSSLQLVPREFASEPIIVKKANVIAVHCSGSSHKQWTPLCDALGPNHRVVAPNLFGAGGTSPWPPHGRPQTLDDTAALVETAAKDALGDDDRAPIVVGHSHGAAVALRYAATREVSGVVVVEPNYMSLLEAAAPFDDKVDEASRIGGVDDAGVFLGRMMASAQMGFQGWGECFHRFWLAEEESHTWAMVPEPQQKVLLESTIPHCAYEIGSIDGARGHSSKRDLAALEHVAAKHLVLSARPGVGSQRCLRGLRAVLERIGFTTSILTKGGHLAPLTHPAETAEHVARLVGECES